MLKYFIFLSIFVFSSLISAESDFSKISTKEEFNKKFREVLADPQFDEEKTHILSYEINSLIGRYTGLDLRYTTNEEELKILKSMPPGFGIVRSTHSLETWMANNDIVTYLIETKGLFLQMALNGYTKTKATSEAKWLEKVISEFELNRSKLMEHPPVDGTVEQLARLDKFPKLKTLNDEYKKLDKDVYALRKKFIKEQPELFIIK
jgi:hypothetical protein